MSHAVYGHQPSGLLLLLPLQRPLLFRHRYCCLYSYCHRYCCLYSYCHCYCCLYSYCHRYCCLYSYCHHYCCLYTYCHRYCDCSIFCYAASHLSLWLMLTPKREGVTPMRGHASKGRTTGAGTGTCSVL